jgi:methylmalonyl-CoA/ethylmalonyl-CoA epimerase
MNSIFERITRGNLHQTAYVTNDVRAAAERWSRTLGLPEMSIDHIDGISGFEYRGAPAVSTHDQAIGYLGGMQIEFIEPLSGQNVYFEALEGAEPGAIVAHHLGFDCVSLDDYLSVKEELVDDGFAVVQSGFFGDTQFAYFDTRDAIGTYLELLWLDEPTRAGFDQIRARFRV